jgi:hypothetical protein
MNFDNTITCPNCKASIPVGEAVAMQIEERVRQQLRNEFNEKFKLEIGKREKKIREQAIEDLTLQMKDLKSELDEKAIKLKEASEKELALLREKRELEEQKQNLRLDLERQLSSERERITKEASDRAAEEYRLKLAERDQKMSEMAKQIDDLKRKAEQGSQQTQGETLEVEIENLLHNFFREDRIQPVPKGIRGADVIQEVMNKQGHYCGTILWESKRTKAWSDGWIGKLKSDCLEINAQMAVLVSTVLPKDVGRIGQIDGVWVVDFVTAMELAIVLRASLIEVAHLQAAMVGKNEKIERVYAFITSQEFRQRVESLIGTFADLKKDLDQEKRAMERIWSRREKQIETVLQSTAGLYGQLQGIIGASLPPIAQLELPASDDDQTSIL